MGALGVGEAKNVDVADGELGGSIIGVVECADRVK